MSTNMQSAHHQGSKDDSTNRKPAIRKHFLNFLEQFFLFIWIQSQQCKCEAYCMCRCLGKMLFRLSERQSCVNYLMPSELEYENVSYQQPLDQKGIKNWESQHTDEFRCCKFDITTRYVFVVICIQKATEKIITLLSLLRRLSGLDHLDHVALFRSLISFCEQVENN